MNRRRAVLEVAGAQSLRPKKGEDGLLVRTLDHDRYLVAVADGLSLHSGRVAAEAVVKILREVTAVDSIEAVFAALRTGLEGSLGEVESDSTVTCALLSIAGVVDGPCLRCDYFAIGDSPIWRVVRAPAGDRYTFQRYVIHGPPYPAEAGKVYSTASVRRGQGITGPVALGRVEIPSGEILAICSDGVPERELFVRDQRMQGGMGGGATLAEAMFASAAYDDRAVEQFLRSYDARGVLSDDATLVIARVRPQEGDVATDAAPGVEGDVAGIRRAVELAAARVSRREQQLGSRERASEGRRKWRRLTARRTPR